MIFKNMCEFFREKSQIAVLSTFDQCELKRKNYFDKNVYSVLEQGKKCPFLHTVHIFFKIIIFFNSRWLKVLNETIWEFSLKHAYIF